LYSEHCPPTQARQAFAGDGPAGLQTMTTTILEKPLFASFTSLMLIYQEGNSTGVALLQLGQY
jgi:hypothetical protein